MYVIPQTLSLSAAGQFPYRHRRVWGLGAASSDVVQGMVSEGFDADLVNALALAGATDSQLQALWDAYEPKDPAFTAAANNLLNSLIGSAVRTYVSQPHAVAQPTTSAVAAAQTWWDQSSLGIPNKYLVGGGAGIVLLLLLRPRR